MDVSLQHDELRDLLIALTDGEIDRVRFDRLQAILSQDASAQAYFRRYIRLCALLEFDRAESEGESLVDRNDEEWTSLGEVTECHESTVPFPSLSPFPSPSTTHYPLSTNFVGGPVFSYMVATVVLCAMLLSAWAYKVTLHENNYFVKQSPPAGQSAPQYVGRVTGMKDCVWADKQTETILGAYVPFDRKYALSSGLLEITYASGARVILEGPCEYKVNSDAGGYLARGKLTARVEKRVASGKWQVARNKRGNGQGGGGVVSGQWSVASAKLRATTPQPPTPNPQPLTPLFSVTTPTAVVTDLGTEFGVEVGEDGATKTLVFKGSVRLTTIAAKDTGKILLAGQFGRVLPDKPAVLANGMNRIATNHFTRNMPRPMSEFKFIGPLPYQSFENRAATPNVSPFAKSAGGPFGPLSGVKGERRWNGSAGQYFHLEDFEMGAIHAPGLWIISHGRLEVIGAGRSTDSVDEDDGTIDAATNPALAHSIHNQGTNRSLRIGFDAKVLGRLPTHVGLAITDCRPAFDTIIEVFGEPYRLLGKKRLHNESFAESNVPGPGAAKKARFIGMVSTNTYANSGISLVVLTEVPTDGVISDKDAGIEIDHIQYGFAQPENDRKEADK